MKKYLIVIIIFICSVSACEQDDFCVQNPVTPNLVIKFMNYDNIKKLKKTDSIYVWATNKDSLYKKIKLDSILLPLNTNATSTVYNLAKGKDSISQLTISYQNDTEYVSRSCGYRAIFKNVTFTEGTTTKSWIDSLSVTKITTLNNQTNAHLIIYH